MSKYGVLKEDIRFEQDNWVLVVPPERHEGLDCIHGCNSDTDMVGIYGLRSYALPYHAKCPGCDTKMPDEVQGLFQMANMNGAYRVPDGYVRQIFERCLKESMKKMKKQMFLSLSTPRSGAKITGITVP